MAQSNSVFARIGKFLKSVAEAAQQRQADLRLHRDMWLGRRDPALEKSVSHYSY